MLGNFGRSPGWKFGGLIVALMLVATLALAACGDDDEEDAAAAPTTAPAPTATPQTVGGREEAETKIAAEPTTLEASKVGYMMRAPEPNPKSGGELRTSWPIAVQHFDLHQGAIAYGGMTMIYNNLVFRNQADGLRTMVPDLAESWEISADGLTYTFPLRQGVKWHDGTDFTSADVEATFARFFDPPAGVSVGIMTDMFEAVEGVEAVDPNTVQINLKRITPWFLELLSADPLFGPAVIYQKAALDAANGDLRNELSPGTGPFTLGDRQPGELWVLEANANYWNPDLPYVDSIRQFHVPAWPDRGTAVLTGQSDFAWNGSVDTWNEAAKEPDKYIVGKPFGTGYWGPYLNNTRPPFDDQRVRKAIHLAVDKWKIAEIMGSVVIPFHVSRWMTPASPYAGSTDSYINLPGYRTDKTADIAEAQRLMAEAGYGDGVEIEVTLSNPTPYTEVVGPAYLAQLRDLLGIEVKSTDVIERALEGDTLTAGNWDLFLGPSGWDSVTGDPTVMWRTYIGTGGARNFGGYSNAELDAVLDEMLTELDPAARQDLADQVIAILDEDPPLGGVASSQQIPMAWRYVKGLDLETRQWQGWLRFEVVWLDK